VLVAAQRALGYQIATYESACGTARDVGAYTLLDILLLNLDEEKATSAALADLAGRDAPLLRAI
jgi:ferritin-like metal-binding protein YciE